MPYPFVDMILYFFIYSFCGWLMETVLCSVKQRRFINRGFLYGPICPIYGCGVLLMLIFLIPVRDTVTPFYIAVPVVFIAGTALASAVEYSTSWAMEKLFHARWWDYSGMRLNVNGRVCLTISLAWGALATVFLFFGQPLFESLLLHLHTVSRIAPAILAALLSLVLFADIAVSVRVAAVIGIKLELLDKWAELIREHAESLELPSREAVVRKLEQAYERFAAYGARFRQRRRENHSMTEPEWRALPLAALRRRLSESMEELRAKRDALIAGIHPLQKRMLEAFPHMVRPGAALSLRDLRQYLIDRRKAGKEKRNKGGDKKQ